MPYLRTDDGPRKLRAVWLGPAGHTLAFQWTYVQWLVTLLTVPVTAALGATLLRLLGADWVWTAGIGVLWGGAAGLWVAVRLMRNVTFDEPLRYQRRLLRGEFDRRSSAVVEDRGLAVSFAPPPVGYLSVPVLRAMGWDSPEQRPAPGPAVALVPATVRAALARAVTLPAEVPPSSEVERTYLSSRDLAPVLPADDGLRVAELVLTSSAASWKASHGPQDDH